MDYILITTVLLTVAGLGGAGYLALRQPRHDRDALQVTQLYVYPVKGLRGAAVEEAQLGKYGVVGDRTFCLQRMHRDQGKAEPRYETMLAGYYLQLALFRAAIQDDVVVVSWHARGTDFSKDLATTDEIRFPLRPSVEGRPELQANLHTSTTMAFDMGDDPAAWFTDRLGFETRLVYIGDGSRPVLGSLAPNSRGGLLKGRVERRLRSLVPGMSYPAERLAFNDIAHYLVVTEESNQQVSSRLDQGCTQDIRKFRPNIVVKGASRPFAEDFWGELTFDGGVRMPLTANCYRCQSIVVDYATGKTATDDRGMAWKKLNKDRRVDKGAKYSPVFGRYGYCFGSAQGKTIRVGSEARVTYVNAERTTFDWPHLTSFGMSQVKK